MEFQDEVEKMPVLTLCVPFQEDTSMPSPTFCAPLLCAPF